MIAGRLFLKVRFGNEPRQDGCVAIVAVDTDLDSAGAVAASDAADMLEASRVRVSQMLLGSLLEGIGSG